MVVAFDREDIVDALGELVEVLASRETKPHIRIVGGAAIAMCHTRDATTTDVDALYGSDPDVEVAAVEIAQRRGWPDNWLNDKAKMFASHFDADDDWVSFDLRDGLVVRVAGPQLLLAMKLWAARGRRDAGDIDLLLDACQVTSVSQAVAIFERYYPEESLSERACRQLSARLS